MTDMPSELKPCPFCGGEAYINDYEAKHGGLSPRSGNPSCRSCGCSLGYHTTRARAIAAWNTRAELTSTKARLAEAVGHVSNLTSDGHGYESEGMARQSAIAFLAKQEASHG